MVASHRKNYTSLCAAQYDIKTRRSEKKFNSYEDQSNETDRIKDNDTRITDANDLDNDHFNIFEENFKSVYRRRKFGGYFFFAGISI